jgi:hypothetical protein
MAEWRIFVVVELKDASDLAGRDAQGRYLLQEADWAEAERIVVEWANEMFERLGFDYRLRTHGISDRDFQCRPRRRELSVPVPWGKEREWAERLRRERIVQSVTVPRNPVRAPTPPQIAALSPLSHPPCRLS